MAKKAKADRESSPIEPISLRPKEAALALGICERLLREWTNQGDIPHVRVGGVLLYPVAEVRSWLSLKVVQSDSAAST